MVWHRLTTRHDTRRLGVTMLLQAGVTTLRRMGAVGVMVTLAAIVSIVPQPLGLSSVFATESGYGSAGIEDPTPRSLQDGRSNIPRPRIARLMPSSPGDLPLVERVDVDTLAPGRHDFYLEIGTRASGSPLMIPVIVLRGSKPGKRLLLTAAVHGDELNGIAIIHRLVASIKPADLAGTLIMVPGVNPTGIEHHSRFFHSSQNGGSMGDLNRAMPGDLRSRGAVKRVAATFWAGLVVDNVDIAIDLHTQTRGTAYPLFVFADFRNDAVKQMAYDLQPEVIKNDRGQRGTLETSLLSLNIPTVTFEIGAPKLFQMPLVERAHTGILTVMRRHKMLAGAPTRTLPRPIVGKDVTNIATRRGGFAYIEVTLLQQVKKGQTLARVLDPFGQELDRYIAPHDGTVLALSTDPVREQGSLLVRLLR